MSTKKQPEICRVPSGKPVNRVHYNKLRQWLKAQSQRAAADGDDLPVPHLMPPYGGPCFEFCYREALAYKRACQARASWLSAKYDYTVTWDATESCLSGFPV